VGQPDLHLRRRHPHDPVTADDELEPALGLDQVFRHGEGQRGQTRGVELRREVRKVDSVGGCHDALEEDPDEIGTWFWRSEGRVG